MEHNGYTLYDLLKDGAETTITHNGTTYTLRFVGQKTGSDNYLLVKDGRGQEKKYGWGWSSEICWRFLSHLEAGWDTPQRPSYKAYNAGAETEGGVTY
jgi:hypothetical protein